MCGTRPAERLEFIASSNYWYARLRANAIGQEKAINIYKSRCKSSQISIYDNTGPSKFASLNPASRCKTKDGETPLFGSVTEGHVACTQLLVEAKADVKATDSQGRSVLEVAEGRGQQDAEEG